MALSITLLYYAQLYYIPPDLSFDLGEGMSHVCAHVRRMRLQLSAHMPTCSDRVGLQPGVGVADCNPPRIRYTIVYSRGDAPPRIAPPTAHPVRDMTCCDLRLLCRAPSVTYNIARVTTCRLLYTYLCACRVVEHATLAWLFGIVYCD